MDWMRETFAVAFVLSLLLALVWLARAKAGSSRSGLFVDIKSRKSSEGRLTLLDRLSLTPSNSLHLVRADARLLVLSVHSAGVVLLCELTTPAECEK